VVDPIGLPVAIEVAEAQYSARHGLLGATRNDYLTFIALCGR
jgi:hypothetical protein